MTNELTCVGCAFQGQEQAGKCSVCDVTDRSAIAGPRPAATVQELCRQAEQSADPWPILQKALDLLGGPRPEPCPDGNVPHCTRIKGNIAACSRQQDHPFPECETCLGDEPDESATDETMRSEG
jgi:hypothetical protein